MIMVLSVSARGFTTRQFANLPSSYSSYHPKDPFTELDISDTHVNQLYACASSTLNLARLRYWIPAGRQHVRKAINHCGTCKTILGLPHNIQDTLKQYHLQSLTRTLQELQLYTSVKLEPKRILYLLLYMCYNKSSPPCSRYRSFGTNVLSRVGCAARRSVPQQIISDNASTSPLAAEEVTALFSTQTLKSSLSKQGVHQRFIAKRRILGKVNERHKDNSEEGPWTIIFNSYHPAHHFYLN